jgi:integrase
MTNALTSTCSLEHASRSYRSWRTDEAGFSPKTVAGETPGLLAFVDLMHTRGVFYVDTLTDVDLSAWWASLAGHADSTKVTRLAQLRAFLDYCRVKGWLTHDPTVLLRAAHVAPALRERLNAFELLSLIESADFPQHRIVLALAANLALRGGEIRALKVRDVDLTSMTVRVHIEKTKDSDDLMPVNDDLARELDRWLRHYSASCSSMRQASCLVPAQHVEPTKGRVTYNPDRSVAQPYDIVKAALTRIGWQDVKGEGIHTVRRSVARIFFDAALEEAGDSQFDEVLLGTMRLLHHARPETTLRYIGVDRQTQARDKFLRGRPFLTRLARVDTPKLEVVR